MAKTKISEYSATPASNTDISNINIAEGCSPANVNNAIRSLMAQLKDLQAGTSGDTIPLTAGGTGSTTASDARTALSAAKSGANSDITSITGLTTPVTTAQGGTGTASTTFANLTTNVTGTLPVANGGTGVTSSTGSGNTVLSTSPTLVTPALGTPSAVVLTNATGTANSLNAGIGVNQTWTNVTASRAYGTTYTNSTGKPISVTVSGGSTGSGSFIHIVYVNSNEIAYQTTYSANAGYRHNVFFIVPNSATYSVTGVGGINTTALHNWSELR